MMETGNTYDKMSIEELETERESLEAQFDAYKSMLAEIYAEMGALSDAYSTISEIINNRKNG